MSPNSRWSSRPGGGGRRSVVVLVVALGVLGIAGVGISRAQLGTTPSGSGSLRLHEVWRPPIESIGPERVATAPPGPVAETPPPRPSAKAVWIEGYWDHDPEAGQYVWVPGAWRVPPPGRTWVAGRWQRDAQGWFRSPGFWTTDLASPYRQTGPPADAPPEEPGPRPSAVHIRIPGHYAPQGDSVAWKPGYWARFQPGWTWVRAAWLRRPEGWVYQEGFWVQDDALRAAHEQAQGVSGGIAASRGVRHAPTAGPLTDRDALLRAWGSELGRRAAARGNAPDTTAVLESLLNPYGSFPHQIYNAPSGAGGSFGRAPAPGRADRPGFYVGHSLPGTSYPSYSLSPPRIPGQATYVGSTLPGTAYPSYSLSPSATPGGSFYAGRSLPGTSYPSYSPSASGSINNYGYGTAPPGNTAGQLGVNP